MKQDNATTARITVILPAYNAAATIAHAIKSVQAQSCPDWVLVIIDDGSTDSTANIARMKAADDPRLQLISQENAGVAAARNAGVAVTETDLIAFLDADDALAPVYLERMIAAHDEDPDLALVCCDAWTFRQEGVPLQHCSENYGMVPPVTLKRVLAREFQIYAAASLKTSWYRKVGGTDESFRNSVDLDLWVRVLLAGGVAAYIDEPLA
ncbi:MAG: glycosyltransferase family A protein, partial [Pseudomonadota bacterium]